jgi:hypothetical protein
MTGIEYLKKQDRAFHWLLALGLLGAVAGAVLSGIIYRHLGPYPSPGDGPRNFSVFCGYFGGTVIAMLVHLRWWKIFKSRHPEMANLDEWTCIVGSAEKYPVNADDAIALIPEITTRLASSARRANAAFAMRDRVKAMFGNEAGTPERILAEQTYQHLAAAAETWNKKYLTEWRLFVEKIKIPLPFLPSDPRTYREGFLKKA